MFYFSALNLKRKTLTRALGAAALVLCIGSAAAQTVPIPDFPIPETVSPEARQFMAGDVFQSWLDRGGDTQDWKNWVEAHRGQALANVEQLINRYQVQLRETTLGGVNVYQLLPKEAPAVRPDRAILHFHGGGYVLNAGKAGLDEAIMMTGITGYPVVSVNYRMPPEHPFPAAMDDALNVYRALIEEIPAERVGVMGTSTGGGMTLSLMLRIKEAGLPMPAAQVLGTPWSDLSKTGDSYYTHQGIDRVLVHYDGRLRDAALLYANGEDLKNPLLSPVYGDLRQVPPAFLYTGTRDLFLSNTVRTHIALRDAGVDADLMVIDGMSHSQYTVMPPEAAETQRYFQEAKRWFDRYLKP